MQYPRGSEWRKWDLHVHTPCSLVQKYGSNNDATWEKFLLDLEKLPPEFKVIGINDYIFVDGYRRVLQERKKGRLANIDLILPVIELRIDKFGGTASGIKRANLHVIFDELDPDLLEEQFIAGLTQEYTLTPEYSNLQSNWAAKVSRQSIEDLGRMIIESVPLAEQSKFGTPMEEGFANLNFSYEVTRKALRSHYFQDRYVTAVGKAEWAAIQWNDHTIAEKKKLINESDLVFTSAESAEALTAARQALVVGGVNSRLLDCSDAHDYSTAQYKDRIGKCYTWVKADPTFVGLKHAIKEYEKRIFLGHRPEKLDQLVAASTKFIDRIKVAKKTSASVSENWFDDDLPLNSDLVAIIGNKGSGKSALADILGLLGSARTTEHFSFLNAEKFKNPRANKAPHFLGTITWRSGESTTRGLEEVTSGTEVERVRYLPQNYIESICNEISVGGERAFDTEIKRIIYEHVAPAERLGFETLDQVVDYRTESIADRINVMQRDIGSLNARIAGGEETLEEEHKASLESRLVTKEGELAALLAAKPEEVKDPAVSEVAQAAIGAAREQIEVKTAELAKANASVASLEERRRRASKENAVVARIIGKIENFAASYRGLVSEVQAELDALGSATPAKASELVKLEVHLSPLTSFVQGRALELESASKELDSQVEGSIAARIRVLMTEIAQATQALDEPTKAYINYLAAVAAHQKQVTDLIGDESTPETVEWLRAQLAALKRLPTVLEQLRLQRETRVREVHKQLQVLAGEYRSLYLPAKEFLEKEGISKEKIPLQFEARIVEEGFSDTFLDYLNRGAKGSFSGKDEGASRVKGLIDETDFADEEQVIAFLRKLEMALGKDLRKPHEPDEVRVRAQLRKDVTLEQLYDFLFSLSYLIPRYALKFGERDIHQLSPGERGLLLLVFYLLVDVDDCPLIVDQPEENLDNQTIYDVVVQCISRAKLRRQIVVVTHNPNLAIVCDAEQIVYAAKDVKKGEIRYASGSIEDPIMNRHVIDVLEGTRPAFDNREGKYFA